MPEQTELPVEAEPKPEVTNAEPKRSSTETEVDQEEQPAQINGAQ